VNILKRTIVVLFVITAFLSCHESKALNWPENVKTAFFIPQEVRSRNDYELKGTYQTIFQTKSCWPGGQYIEMIGGYMSQRGWKKLDEDPLNPGLNPHWRREGSLTMKWGHFIDKDNKDVFQWMEGWEDIETNLVRYSLKYRNERKDNVLISPESCDIDVIIIFTPKDIHQKIMEELKALRNKDGK